jgi:3-phosphoshikimate 1-carboxyvinyltransferase
MRAHIGRATRLSGQAHAPGDKSVSHRALIFSALSERDVETEIEGLAPGGDVRSTARCLASLGVSLSIDGARARVRGVGLDGWKTPSNVLDCGNSGTTLRLLSGIVAGAGLAAELDGDESLRRRPMRRVLDPLRSLGARASGRAGNDGEELAPLRFEGGQTLNGRDIVLPLASAQVKTCVLLAGLWARGETSVREPQVSRDHTERMLQAMGAPLTRDADGAWRVRTPGAPLRMSSPLRVPGDPSSAAFLLGAGLLVPGELSVVGVDVNPSRSGLLQVLERMGASIEREQMGERAGEPVARLIVRGAAKLRGTSVHPEEVPSMVDEVPLLAILATQAEGTTTVRGASELRVKESDRLAQVVNGLKRMGARAEELPDGWIIEGPTPLHGATIDAVSDHRIAMSFAVAGLIAEGETVITGAEWADISFPGFFELLGNLGAPVRLE